jgi:glutathione S-transferase
VTDPIYHVALTSDWTDAHSAGEYRVSTRGTRLDEVGYIHASFAHQVRRLGAAVYGDAPEPVVVLVIDPTRLTSPVRVENLDGGTEGFPHIYGPIPIDAVIDVLPARLEGDEFIVPGLAPRA